jgi:PLD-like domain
MVGAVLYGAADPAEAARSLAGLLAAGVDSPGRVRSAGFEPALVDALRHALPHEPRSIELACMEGAAWVVGRRSVPPSDTWELVASLPASLQLPAGLRRTTGETLVGLVSEAERLVRIVAPYVDETGLGVVAEVAAAATTRGVELEVFQQTRWARGEREALGHLRHVVASQGNIARFKVVLLSPEAPFGHLKVVTADGATAYVGSANMTAAALMGRNVELGVLLRGSDVSVIERLLDLYRTA